jgi:hypothetical protein
MQDKTMKTVLNTPVLFSLLVTASTPSVALMSIGVVSRERAEEFGMVLRSTASGPKAVWVELEFKREGKLKDLLHVSLEIREGDELLVGYAALREKRSRSGAVVVSFMANRAYLDKITLTVVVGAPMNMTGYEVRVRDFVDLGEVDKRTPDVRAARAEGDSAARPAVAVEPTAE